MTLIPFPIRGAAARRGAAAMGALAASLALSGCSHNAGQMTSFAGRGRGPRAQLFAVPAVQRGHIQVITVAPRSLPRILRLTGTVSYNQFETTTVISQLDGQVGQVLAVPGESVRAGQPLAIVNSTNYSQLRAQYLKNQDAAVLAGINDRRAHDLYAHHAIALQEMEKADSDLRQSQADLQASRQALRILGIADPQQAMRAPASPLIAVRAPIAGIVVSRSISPGQVVAAGTTECFRISNMRSVWVLADVYQNQLAYIQTGEAATIRSDAYARAFHGRISYIAPAVDPATRTLQVRIVTANPRLELKKDMYVTADVAAGRITRALVVPDAALLRNDENQSFVYREMAPGKFGEQLVSTGESQDGVTEILSGLRAGDRVIGNGSLFLQFAAQNR